MIRSTTRTNVAACALALLLASPAAAAPPGDHLSIENVFVVFGSPDTLLILGEDFDFGSPLEVTLGGAGALTIASASDTEIVAELPPGLLPGDYLLTVSTGQGQSQNDEYDLTIGARPEEPVVCPCFTQEEVDAMPVPIDQCREYWRLNPGLTVTQLNMDSPPGGGFFPRNVYAQAEVPPWRAGERFSCFLRDESQDPILVRFNAALTQEQYLKCAELIVNRIRSTGPAAC